MIANLTYNSTGAPQRRLAFNDSRSQNDSLDRANRPLIRRTDLVAQKLKLEQPHDSTTTTTRSAPPDDRPGTEMDESQPRHHQTVRARYGHAVLAVHLSVVRPFVESVQLGFKAALRRRRNQARAGGLAARPRAFARGFDHGYSCRNIFEARIARANHP